MNIKQFSKEHLSSVLDAFIRIKGGEMDDPDYGICYNATMISGRCAYTLVGYFSQGWYYHSGRSSYPVPFKGVNTGNMWEGEYGALRYELLDFLIDELTKVVEKCNG